jgi:hypothetical protein
LKAGIWSLLWFIEAIKKSLSMDPGGIIELEIMSS